MSMVANKSTVKKPKVFTAVFLFGFLKLGLLQRLKHE